MTEILFLSELSLYIAYQDLHKCIMALTTFMILLHNFSEGNSSFKKSFNTVAYAFLLYNITPKCLMFFYIF